MIVELLSLTSVLGALLNGYGAGKHKFHILLYGQFTWVLSNLGWVYYYIVMNPNVFQLTMFLSFWIAATFATINMIRSGPEKTELKDMTYNDFIVEYTKILNAVDKWLTEKEYIKTDYYLLDFNESDVIIHWSEDDEDMITLVNNEELDL